MTRCDEFYEKVEKDGNFCGMREDHYTELVAYIRLLRENPQIRGISEEAAKPLIREKDPEVKANAIEAVGKNISHGNIPSGKQVKQILENKRADIKPHGRTQNNVGGIGAAYPVRSPSVALLPGGNDEPGDEPENLDIERDYYSGDTPETPDTQETPETPKAVVAIPQDVAAIEAKMEEERAAQAVKDLQKQKEDEKQKQKDEREYADLKEKNGNVQLLDELVSDLVTAFRAATTKGMPNDLVSDAINLALTAAFPGVQKPGETDDPTTSGRLFK